MAEFEYILEGTFAHANSWKHPGFSAQRNVEQTGIALAVNNHRSTEAADSAFDPAVRANDRKRVLDF